MKIGSLYKLKNLGIYYSTSDFKPRSSGYLEKNTIVLFISCSKLENQIGHKRFCFLHEGRILYTFTSHNTDDKKHFKLLI